MFIDFDDLEEAVFIKRINRFIAEVVAHDQKVNVHVPSTGRLDTVLQEGATCYLKPSRNPARKTPYSLFLIKTQSALVCIDALVANNFTQQLLHHRSIPGMEAGEIRKEVTVGNSRFDFAVQQGMTHLIEVKSVNMSLDGTACFPDAPTQRGTKHVKELTNLQQREDIQTHVLFIIQREDAHQFTPCNMRDPEFSKALKEAWQSGTKIHACLTQITTEKIQFRKWLPIIWDEM